MEWSKNKPKVDGFFWYAMNDNREPITIVEVYDINTSMPSISWIGTDVDKDLNKINGYWFGPISAPERTWL